MAATLWNCVLSGYSSLWGFLFSLLQKKVVIKIKMFLDGKWKTLSWKFLCEVCLRYHCHTSKVTIQEEEQSLVEHQLYPKLWPLLFTEVDTQ